nr:hypothetical protein [Myxococcales bacterium]
AAWLTASITNVFAARALQPPVKSMFTKINASRRASGTENQTKPDEMAFLSRNFFDAEREDLAPIPEPDDETSADNVSIDDGDCIPDRCRASNLSMILVSTWWFRNDSDANVAMFQPST